MHHFSLKSLSFYAIAIGSVLILFNVVSAYGEAKIKAPPAIGGRYRINAENLPKCLQSQALQLDIQQSGIYLYASLEANESNPVEEMTEEKPSLTGLWQQQQVNLSGLAPYLTGCNQSEVSNIPVVNLQGRVEGKELIGKMRLNSLPQEFEFTAQREDPVKRQPNAH